MRNEEVGGKLVDEPCGVEENIFEAGVEVARQMDSPDRQANNGRALRDATRGNGRHSSSKSEAGISIGDQLSVCTIDCEGIGKFMNPPIASFRTTRPSGIYERCVLTGLQEKVRWTVGKGPLLLEPKKLKIFDGGIDWSANKYWRSFETGKDLPHIQVRRLIPVSFGSPWTNCHLAQT